MYEFVVNGECGSAVRAVFDDLVVTVQDGCTTLRGDLADQAAVYGVLLRVQDLGLELVALRRLDAQCPTVL